MATTNKQILMHKALKKLGIDNPEGGLAGMYANFQWLTSLDSIADTAEKIVDLIDAWEQNPVSSEKKLNTLLTLHFKEMDAMCVKAYREGRQSGESLALQTLSYQPMAKQITSQMKADAMDNLEEPTDEELYRIENQMELKPLPV